VDEPVPRHDGDLMRFSGSTSLKREENASVDNRRFHRRIVLGVLTASASGPEPLKDLVCFSGGERGI
jgi:hypothetical protein